MKEEPQTLFTLPAGMRPALTQATTTWVTFDHNTPTLSTSSDEGVTDMTKANVAFLLERRALIDRAIERAILIEERFGKDQDYGNGYIIVAEKKYNTSDTVYTYVFLKVKNGRWYSTSQYNNSEVRQVMTWEQLVDFLGSCERVDAVTTLSEM
jgi:hypothetical protein